MIQSGINCILIDLLFIFEIEELIRQGGLLVVWLIVYAGIGLFFCFFLPVGGALFAAGLLTATGGLPHDILTVCSLLITASVMGNFTGFWFGRKAGPLLYKRKDSRFFKQRHLKSAELFYEKYGWLALTAGWYLPIIRTFAPIVAGIIRLDLRRFFLFTVSGSVIGTLSFILAGYFMGSSPFLKPILKYIISGFILIITVPLLVRIIKEFKKPQK